MKRFSLLFFLLLAQASAVWADPPSRPLITLGVGLKGRANDATQAVLWGRLRVLKHISVRAEAYANGRYAQPVLSATYDFLLFNEHITFFAGPGYTYNNDAEHLYNPQLMAGATLRLGRLHFQGCAMNVLRSKDIDTGLWVGVGYGF
jgi:hypothetical protein